MDTQLLDDARAFVRLYVVITEAQLTAITLWIAHTHTADAAEATPFLAITSPEKRCGKTRLLDVLELLVAKPWRTIMPSEAVMFRKIDKVSPTLLLDETDAIFNSKNTNTEPLRAVLNAGNRRGTSVPRCVGPQQQLVDFQVFCAKALAGIGALPDTVTDRSIVIRMARKRKDETAARFRFREASPEGEQLHRRLAAWGEDALSALEAARPEVPATLDDRAEEAWEPLLAIAELAGGSWPERARTAALQLSGGDHDDEALGARLLADIRDVFASAGTDRLSSSDLAARLCANEESPWGDLWGKTLDARGVARRLRPFAVRPRTVRFDDETTAKGYHLDQFEDVFSRYLGDTKRHNVTTRLDKGVAPVFEPSHVTDGNRRKPAPAKACDGVTGKNAQEATRRVPLPGDPGYLLWIDAKFVAGHITAGELRSLQRVSTLIARRRSALDGWRVTGRFNHEAAGAAEGDTR